MAIIKGREGLEAMKALYPHLKFGCDDMTEEELAEMEFDTEPVRINVKDVAGIEIHADKLLVSTKICNSRSEAQRKIKEGAVYIDRERVENYLSFVSYAQIEEGFELKLGRKMLKVKVDASEL